MPNHLSIDALIASCEYLPVQLTQGYFAIVDAADYLLVCQFHWRYHQNGGYALRDTKNLPKGTSGLMHRLIMAPPEGMVVDHINGNGLDNRRCNLRVCTYTQNRHNQRKYVFTKYTPTSKYKGVKQASKGNRWTASIVIHGKPIHIGSFATEEEAARAYDATAFAAYGEYARLNFGIE